MNMVNSNPDFHQHHNTYSQNSSTGDVGTKDMLDVQLTSIISVSFSAKYVYVVEFNSASLAEQFFIAPVCNPKEKTNIQFTNNILEICILC